MSDTTHHRDGIGVCIYCNACDDPHCCDDGPCDRNVVKALGESRDRILARMRAEGRDC